MKTVRITLELDLNEKQNEKILEYYIKTIVEPPMFIKWLTSRAWVRFHKPKIVEIKELKRNP